MNRRTIKREFVKASVLKTLRTRLMAPEVYSVFLGAFAAEWNRDRGARAVGQEGQRAELKRLARTVGNLVATDRRHWRRSWP